MISKLNMLTKRSWFVIGIAAVLLIGIGVAIVACTSTPQSTELLLSNYSKLFERDAMIIVGGNASQIELESAEAIATNLEELVGNEPITKADSGVSQSDKSDHNLVLVGIPHSNNLLEEVYDVTNATKVTKEYPGENRAILEILRNPWNDSKALLLVAGSDEWGVKAGGEILESVQVSDEPSIVVEWEEATSPHARPAPKTLSLHPGQTEGFVFWKHNITVNYLSSSPEHLLEAEVDGDVKTISIEPTSECTADHCVYNWTSKDLTFIVKPITWVINEYGDKVWSFETWNTTELYFEVSVKKTERG